MPAPTKTRAETRTKTRRAGTARRTTPKPTGRPTATRRVLALAGIAAVVAATIIGAAAWAGNDDPAPPAADAAVTDQTANRLEESIARLQTRLARLPGDYRAWAELGSAYVEQARITADPSYYPKADGALRKSLQIRSADNADALTGLGALANARHDFATARRHALDAVRVAPYDSNAYGVLADAETQLGNADAASAAVRKMLSLRPGLPAYSRLSYDLEQHGSVGEAADVMRQALDAAVDPHDIAFCRAQLAELALKSGRLDDAARELDAGRQVDPGSIALLRARAQLDAHRGRTGRAVDEYARLTEQAPTPGYLQEYGDVLTAAGRTDRAKEQYLLVEAQLSLLASNGATDELAAAEYAADHGKPADALRHARAEYQRRHFAEVTSALAWSLYRNGQYPEALARAKEAGALGWKDATLAYRLGMIELALGDRDGARRDLTRALDTDPHFSPLHAPLARKALDGLGAR
jgi:tetratricopeptide (TPR) repeat protein